MQQILVYSDSLTWGIVPNTRRRLSFDQRWPGVLEQQLNQNIRGEPVRVLENCLNGRRTVWNDPFKDGRNGAEGLAQVIEMHSPLRLVLLMLGNNDFQSTHQNDAWMSAQGNAKLIEIIRQAPIEPGMPIPEIMLIAPPPIEEPKGPIARKFKSAAVRSKGLAELLSELAEDVDCHFFDAGSVTSTSAIDGIHLDDGQHMKLGLALAAQLTNLVETND